MNWKRFGKMFAIAATVGVGGATLIIANNTDKKAPAGGCSDKGCSISHKAAAKPAKDQWAFLPEVVATIGKDKITKAQFIKEISPMLPPGQSIPEERLKLAVPKMIENIVDKTILLKLAQKDGIVPGSKQVLAEFDKTYGQLPEKDKKQFEMMLKMQNMSMADYKKKISTDTMAQEGMAISQWVAQYVAKKISISDNDIKEYYDKNPKFFQQPEKVAASHILIKPDAEAKDKAKADSAAKKKAEDLLAKITKGAESFEKLAETESACPSGKSAKGSLGEFGKGQMVPEFEQAAFALEPNKLSKVIKTQFGYHIIKVTGKKAATTIPYTEVKPKIKEKLNGQEIQKTLKALIAKEKERLKVKINV